MREESTYQLLIQSEQKERGLIEAIVYLLLVIATTTTIWQFSLERVTFAEIGSNIAGIGHLRALKRVLRSLALITDVPVCCRPGVQSMRKSRP